MWFKIQIDENIVRIENFIACEFHPNAQIINKLIPIYSDEIPTYFPFVKLSEFVVMPNHDVQLGRLYQIPVLCEFECRMFFLVSPNMS